MRKMALLCSVAGGTLALVPTAFAATVANPICTDNTALYDPGNGQDIVVPQGYTVSLFKSGLNFPTGIAFRKIKQSDGSNDQGWPGDNDQGNGGSQFEVYVLESGHGLLLRRHRRTGR